MSTPSKRLRQIDELFAEARNATCKTEGEGKVKLSEGDNSTKIRRIVLDQNTSLPTSEGEVSAEIQSCGEDAGSNKIPIIATKSVPARTPIELSSIQELSDKSCINPNQKKTER